MAAIWTRAQTEYLIQELELHPALHSVHNTNKEWKEQSLLQLRAAIQEVRPGTTIDEIKKKVKSLRDQYRREYIKVNQAKKEGERHKSQLWCFPLLTFFNQSDDEGVQSPPPIKIKRNQSQTPSPSEERKISVTSPAYSDQQESTTDEHTPQPAVKRGRPAKPDINDVPKRYLECYLKRKEGTTSEHADFLQYIASQLCKISDYDVLYRTKMGILSELESGVREQKESNDFKIMQMDGGAGTSSQMFKSHFVAVQVDDSREIEEDDDLL